MLFWGLKMYCDCKLIENYEDILFVIWNKTYQVYNIEWIKIGTLYSPRKYKQVLVEQSKLFTNTLFSTKDIMVRPRALFRIILCALFSAYHARIRTDLKILSF